MSLKEFPDQIVRNNVHRRYSKSLENRLSAGPGVAASLDFDQYNLTTRPASRPCVATNLRSILG
jgi:hypothetical protein